MTSRTLLLTTTAGDCWASKTSVGLFDNTSDFMYLAGGPSTGDDPWDWIPFVVQLAQGKAISSATLKLTSVDTRGTSCEARFGCDAANSPAAPVSNADLRARTLTTAYNDITMPSMSTGVTYDFDVTAPVQEILNRPGWVPGNTLAILIQDLVQGNNNQRRVASFEHATLTKPQLQLVFPYSVPIGGMLI